MRRLRSLLAFILVVAAFAPAFGQGKTYKVGVIPKFIAEDYFIACERGFRQAEKELGNIKVDWIGDTMSQTSAANQKNYIQSFIDKKYDAILVSALDPESYADTLRAAMKKGIKVITWDADVNPTARDYFVNQAEGDQIAVQLLKGLAGGLSKLHRLQAGHRGPGLHDQRLAQPERVAGGHHRGVQLQEDDRLQAHQPDGGSRPDRLRRKRPRHGG